MTNKFSPTFILGVPRSGTTLLRVLLDSHSEIAGAPETSWITGGYTNYSLRDLVERLGSDKLGATRNLNGVTVDVLVASARSFTETLFAAYLSKRNKKHLVLKTPDDIRYIEFLGELYPDSRYIHMYRDGRDVACSTYAQKGRFFGDKLLSEYGEFTILNSLRRWYDWELKVLSFIENKNVLSVSYESLTADPERVLKDVSSFIGVPFEQEMLDYTKFDHEYPDWEAGSTDVRQKKTLEAVSVGRWKAEIPGSDWDYIDLHFGSLLKRLGYESCNQAARVDEKMLLQRIMQLQDENAKYVSMVHSITEENVKYKNDISKMKDEISCIANELIQYKNVLSWYQEQYEHGKTKIEEYKQAVYLLKNSFSYRLGNRIVSPVKLMFTSTLNFLRRVKRILHK
jgi:hypothetical protein